MNKYYAVVTPDIVGIFTNWFVVSKLVKGTKRTHYKSFEELEGAKAYVFEHLSEEDIQDFGLDRCPIFLNKKFLRCKAFIEKREIAKSQDLDDTLFY